MVVRAARTISDIPGVVHGCTASCGAGKVGRRLAVHLPFPPAVANRSEVTMKRLFAALAVGAMLTTPPSAQHDDWPNGPVRVISTFAAGGTADILARIVAEQLSTAFKQQF